MEQVASLWIDSDVKRGVRDRRIDGPVPQELSIELAEHRDLLARWVRDDANRRTRSVLLQQGGIERAELLCERLLRAGWIERRERLVGGHWQWDSITWRDLERLQHALGVSGKQQRLAERQAVMNAAWTWFKSADRATLAPELSEDLESALQKLSEDRTLKHDSLVTRVSLVRSLAEWCDSGAQGLRRDFALKARGATKAVSEADWRWLDSCFDLEQLRISNFAPVLWVAGDASLQWEAGRMDLSAVCIAGVSVSDILKLKGVNRAPSCYWLVENRASFERQAQSLAAGELLVWLPGRPSVLWMEAMAHLLRLAPAFARISADADPAGVDIACTAGALWETNQLTWEPYRMGVHELHSTGQRWTLNAHDLRLLEHLSERKNMRAELKDLCEAMKREGRKAEQEFWL